MCIAQIDGQSRIHLHVYQYHQRRCAQEPEESAIAQHVQVAAKGLGHCLLRRIFGGRRPCLLQHRVNDYGRNQAGNGIGNEQPQVRLGDQQAANHRANSDR